MPTSRSFLFSAVGFALLLSLILFAGLPSSEALDFECTICVIVVKVLQNELDDHPQEIQDFLKNKVCHYMPEKYENTCNFIVTEFEPLLVELLEKEATASAICNKLKMFHCDGCSLDKPSTTDRGALEHHHKIMDKMHQLAFLQHVLQEKKNDPLVPHKRGGTFRSSSNGAGELIPMLDLDDDYFAPIHDIVRGADWRGKDCDDQNPHTRPGLLKDVDASTDSNCNGIYGKNEKGELYEELFCASEESSKDSMRQVLMFGDSASSHFHIPPEWFHAQNLTKLLSIIDELDWPQESWNTGFVNSIDGHSVYLKLRKKNRCVHRAFQNVGHNGHESEDFATQVDAISRPLNNTPDMPFLALTAYIGNDVCKHHLDDITSDKVFKDSIVHGLDKLNKIAPPNSKVLLMGLVDATILWNELSNKTHPLGVSYAAVYDFLTCTHANPCRTFLTSDESIRNAAKKRSLELSKVMKSIATEYRTHFSNLELSYVDFPLKWALDYVKSLGIDPSVLIEPVDGFHPSSYANSLFADFVWDFLEKSHPDWLGGDNEYNSLIEKLFGDQGGY